MTFASAIAGATTDGLPYATAKTVPAAEASLFNQTVPGLFDPIPVPYEAAVVASIELSVTGGPASNASYVVLQTDLGDGVWYDLAWCIWTGTTGSANFLLSAGVGGANVFQQTRAVGTSPSSSSSNQCPLGARIRFVGKATLGAGGSSSSGSPGAAPIVAATIKYKLTPLR